MNRRPLRFVALAYAAAVLWLTVGPAPWQTSGNQVDGGILNPDAWTSNATWTTGYLSEMAFNVVMFLPVGVLAALLIRRRRWPLALLAGLGFTTIIELLQVPEPDRISDPRDLVMNTAGAVLGVLIVLAARMVRRAGAVVAVVATPAPLLAQVAEGEAGLGPVDEPSLVGAAQGGAAGPAT
jgi:glycopeptide antibiotics resistance protein